jgi:hypothetical protein
MFDQIVIWISENWIKSLGLLTFLAVLPAYFRARWAWRRRLFMARINFSVNFLEDGWLRFRTIHECDLARVFANNLYAIRLVTTTAKDKRRQGAFVTLAEDEARTVLNSILNEVSSRFALGQIARSMGVAVRVEEFRFGLTFEKHADVLHQKFRVMLVPSRVLDQVETLVDVRFEDPKRHPVRLETLREMARLTRDDATRHNVGKLDLAVPI